MSQLLKSIRAIFIRMPRPEEVPEPVCDRCGEEMMVIYGGGEFDIFCRTCDEVTGEERKRDIADFCERYKLPWR